MNAASNRAPALTIPDERPEGRRERTGLLEMEEPVRFFEITYVGTVGDDERKGKPMTRCANCLRVVQPGSTIREQEKSFCPHCRERLCRLCGCTEAYACKGGCAWNDLDPSVCSSHELETEQAD